MKIDGKALADGMLTKLSEQIKKLRTTPTLAVILVGDDPESLSYIRQKQKATERIGGKFIFEHLPKTTTQKELTARVDMYDKDQSVHGLIVQRPLPPGLNAHVLPGKDVDGFVRGSLFEVPIAMAVFTLLADFDIRDKKIVIVGRGETAGKPIAEAFAKIQCATSIISSATPDPENILRTADIIVSCVGKHVIHRDAVKPGAFIISVGIRRDEEGKLHGDYEEDDVKDIASFYTPTPGGIGPVNIACLMQNLTKACMMMSGGPT